MRAVATVQLAVLALAPAAHAAWSPPHRLDPQIPPSCHIHARLIPAGCFGEPSPRIAINRRGESVAAWVDLRDRVKVAIGDSRGRFGRARVLGPGLRPDVVIGDDGSAVVAWTSGHALRYARRAPGGRFGAPHRLAPPGSREGDDDVVLAPQPDGSIFVAYDSPFRGPKGDYTDRVRTLVLPATGPPGPPATFARGDVSGFAYAPGGELAFCCQSRRVAVRPPGGNWNFVDVPSAEVEGIATSAKATLLGTIDIFEAGDAITLGTPGAIAVRPDGTVEPNRLAPVKRPSKAFGSLPVIDGAGRGLVLYQEKRVQSDFSAAAPLYASVLGSGGFSARRRLDAHFAYEPLAVPTASGAVIAWQRADGRWGMASESGGRFARLRGPAGRVGILGEDASPNRGLAAAGRYVALVWESATDGSIRVAVSR